MRCYMIESNARLVIINVSISWGFLKTLLFFAASSFGETVGFHPVYYESAGNTTIASFSLKNLPICNFDHYVDPTGRTGCSNRNIYFAFFETQISFRPSGS